MDHADFDGTTVLEAGDLTHEARERGTDRQFPSPPLDGDQAAAAR